MQERVSGSYSDILMQLSCTCLSFRPLMWRKASKRISTVFLNFLNWEYSLMSEREVLLHILFLSFFDSSIFMSVFCHEIGERICKCSSTAEFFKQCDYPESLEREIPYILFLHILRVVFLFFLFIFKQWKCAHHHLFWSTALRVFLIH